MSKTTCWILLLLLLLLLPPPLWPPHMMSDAWHVMPARQPQQLAHVMGTCHRCLSAALLLLLLLWWVLLVAAAAAAGAQENAAPDVGHLSSRRLSVLLASG
jgi:hypothetical protein